MAYARVQEEKEKNFCNLFRKLNFKNQENTLSIMRTLAEAQLLLPTYEEENGKSEDEVHKKKATSGCK